MSPMCFRAAFPHDFFEFVCLQETRGTGAMRPNNHIAPMPPGSGGPFPVSSYHYRRKPRANGPGLSLTLVNAIQGIDGTTWN